MANPIPDPTIARAERLAEQERWAEAAIEYERALARFPDEGALMLRLSYAESLQGHYRKARQWAVNASGAAYRGDEELLSLLRRLRTFNEERLLRSLLARWKEAPASGAGLLVEGASHLSNMNDHGAALSFAQAAVERAPSALAPRLIRGQVLSHFGRLDEATADFNWVLDRNPKAISAWWALSRLRKQTAQSNHVQALRKVLVDPALAPIGKAMAGMALHKELDDLGRIDEASQALDQACGAKRSTVTYDQAGSRILVDDLMALPSTRQAAMVDPPERTPLFIVGMHRSGTTLLEQLLDASPQVRGVGELYDFTSAMRYATDHHCKGVIDRTVVERARDVDFAEVGQRYLDGIAWRLGEERFFTDKLPSNFLNIGFICRALPGARILHMVRDPVETCFSNLRELFSEANPYSYDQLELADYFIQYRRLMAHWHAAYPGRILDVDYAELTRDPEGVMRAVASFCGIDYIDAMSDPRSSTRAVSTASAVQVRDRVVHREIPKWAPYAKYLQPLIGALRQGGVEVPDVPA